VTVFVGVVDVSHQFIRAHCDVDDAVRRLASLIVDVPLVKATGQLQAPLTALPGGAVGGAVVRVSMRALMVWT
jgi:hypothetical protein